MASIYFCGLFVILFCGIHSNSQQIPKDSVFDHSIQLVYSVNNSDEYRQYYVNEDALNLITTFMTNDSIEIITAIGQARKGKSYTLNRIISQMTGNHIEPFDTSNLFKPCTHGIWMYLLSNCSSNVVNMATDSAATFNTFPCSNDNKQYIVLDIEGSDTEFDDDALRYATIVTLLSSQTFLFGHQKLFKHDFEHIQYIQTFIQNINGQNIDFDISDINLGAIIREPFQTETGTLKEAVNEDLAKFFDDKSPFNKFVDVHQIPVFSDHSYTSSIQNIVDYISQNKESRMKWINAPKIGILLNDMIEQLNNNKNLTTICVNCTFSHIIEWLPYDSFSECSKKCGTGTKIRNRKCITGNINDCIKFVGGTEQDTQKCNTFKCEWLPFHEWRKCSKNCNGGTQTRNRTCSTGNIQDCKDMFGGKEYETQNCNTRKCQWHAVGSWSACSATCDGGKETRHRKCETGNDSDCEGDNTETKKCNTGPCAKDVHHHHHHGGGGGCFSSDSYVISYPDYIRKNIKDVKLFDKILSYDEYKQTYMFSEAILLGHFTQKDGGNNLVEMISLIFEGNGNITLSGNHMIYSLSPYDNKIMLLPASNVEIGDIIYMNNKPIPVRDIAYVISYPRTVFTANGNIVINGIATSSYTGKNSFDHYAQHYIVKGMYNILSLVSPTTIKNYDSIAWLRNAIYYRGLKSWLKCIGSFFSSI